MPRSKEEIAVLAKDLAKLREDYSKRLQLIHDYLRDDPNDRRHLGGLPAGAPADVVRLARISRVNLMKYVVAARVQNMYVDGFQTPASGDNVDQWRAWQRNKMDARQIGVNRAGLSFGASYCVVRPSDGDAEPVLRGASPRQLTAGYMEADDDWPHAVLWQRKNSWLLIDDQAFYELRGEPGAWEITDNILEHNATYDGEPVCPVVRFRDTDDLDDPCRGIVEPHIALQDQINITSFGLQVAQHYGAFRQRYILGWLAETEESALKMGADKLMMFEDGPEEIKVGEFAQTDVRGHIESREASIRHLATVSQTPVHELLGDMVNLSAEALEAAKASQQGAISENRIVMGEAYEQTLNLAGETMGIAPDPSASVTWQDTRVRSLTEAATAFGLLVEKLGVPASELWDRIPGVAQHEVAQWRQALAEMTDPVAELERTLDRQASSPVPA